MYLCNVSFHGKIDGALGICYPIRTEVKCENNDINSVREALYSTGDIKGIKYTSIMVLNISLSEEIKEN